MEEFLKILTSKKDGGVRSKIGKILANSMDFILTDELLLSLDY